MRKIIFILALTGFIGTAFGQQKSDYQAKGDVAYASQDYQTAIDDYTKAIDSSKIDKSILSVICFYRGESYKNLNQFDKAIKDYTAAIKINPQYREAYWSRAIVYGATRNLRASITDYKKALALTPPEDNVNQATLYCNIAASEGMLGQPDSALAHDSAAIKANPGYARAYNLRGHLYQSINKYPEAITYFTRAIDNYKDNDEKMLSYWYTDLADAKSANKQLKEAINDYSLALKLNPDNGIAYWNRGGAYDRHQDYELAASDYSKAMNYYKDDKENLSKLYVDRATNELGQSLLAPAIKDDSTAIALDPNNKSAYFNLADAYTQNGDYQKAVDEYRAALKFDRNNKKLNAILYFQIATNEYFLKQFDKVIADCTTSISMDPNYSSAYFYRGKVYFKQMHKVDLAKQDFNKVIALDTTKKSVDYIFSLFYIGKGDEAADILQKEVVNTTDESQILGDYYNLACLYSLMNKPDEANNYLKMAIDRGYAKKYAAADEDLDNIRNTADYKSIMRNANN